jgi:ribosomal 30S subunit maturation factor RimM
LNSASGLAAGKILRPHGLNGELYVRFSGAAESPFPEGKSWWLATPLRLQTLTLAAARRHPGKKGCWIVRFHEVASLEQSEALRGKVLFETVEEGCGPRRISEVSPEAVVGWLSVTDGGETVGRVSAAWHADVNPLVEIEYDGGSVPVPWVEFFVRRIEPGRRTVVLTEQWTMLKDL